MNRISVFYEHMAEAMKQENIALDEVCAAVKRFGFDGVELDATRILSSWTSPCRFLTATTGAARSEKYPPCRSFSSPARRKI